MESISIKATKREVLGRKTALNLRREDQIPSVMYGGKDILHFYAHEFEFKKIVFTPNVYIINLELEGKTYKCILQDAQYHPLSDKMVHADFLEVNDTKPVSIKIPVKLTGVSEGVKQGGKLAVKMRTLKVKGLVKNLPDVLEIDITKLGLGQAIKIEKLAFPNLEIIESKSAVVCIVNATRASVKEVAPAAKK